MTGLFPAFLSSIAAPGTPPQKSTLRVVLLGLKLSKLNEQHVPSYRLNNRSRAVKPADAFIVIREARSIVVGKRANSVKCFIRFPLNVTHGTPDLGDFGAAIPAVPANGSVHNIRGHFVCTVAEKPAGRISGAG